MQPLNYSNIDIYNVKKSHKSIKPPKQSDSSYAPFENEETKPDSCKENFENQDNATIIPKTENPEKMRDMNSVFKKIYSQNNEEINTKFHTYSSNEKEDSTKVIDAPEYNMKQLMPTLTKSQNKDMPLNKTDYNNLESSISMPSYDYTNMVSGNQSNADLLKKLDYIIYLLEENQNQKTNYITEELILYIFLGVFIIFVLDNFAKSAKYVR